VATAPKKTALTAKTLLARKKWTPLPAVVALTGNAKFFASLVLERFISEVFADAQPDVRRFQGPTAEREAESLPLATILDELRTPSFFSAARVVVITSANVFLTTHGKDLEPHLEAGFSGGHLVLLIDGKLDKRTRFFKQLNKVGWTVDCVQPYDRPPPWDTRTPVWDSELSHWVVERAREKKLRIDPETAYLLHERAGKELALLDEELEKLATFLAAKKRDTVSAEDISSVVGDLREDSIFRLTDSLLEGRAVEALDTVDRLFERGQQSERGTRAVDPMGIALPFLATLSGRLRALRRAHAMARSGAGRDPDAWLRAGLAKRPFLATFTRQFEAVTPRKINRMFQRLYEIDRGLKLGRHPRREIEFFVGEFASKAWLRR